eukprot:scaffold268747_cov27-Prasinocladus_malaysianus.AAC.1
MVCIYHAHATWAIRVRFGISELKINHRYSAWVGQFALLEAFENGAEMAGKTLPVGIGAGER